MSIIEREKALQEFSLIDTDYYEKADKEFYLFRKEMPKITDYAKKVIVKYNNDRYICKPRVIRYLHHSKEYQIVLSVLGII